MLRVQRSHCPSVMTHTLCRVMHTLCHVIHTFYHVVYTLSCNTHTLSHDTLTLSLLQVVLYRSDESVMSVVSLDTAGFFELSLPTSLPPKVN